MKIIMRNIDASNITNMKCMFKLCKSIKTLDLSSFDTRKVTNMNGMFRGCLDLKTLDLLSFDTSKVTGMYCMFDGCSSLKEVKLPKDSYSREKIIKQLQKDNIHCQII